MIICLVTDRRRADPVAQARHAVGAGIDVLQLREPGLEGAALAVLVRTVVAIARGTGTRVVVNDRVDVAMACGADGVHLRADSLAPEAARRLVPAGFLIGRSVHSTAEARQAGPVDYVIAGTMFPTPSKPGRSDGLDEPGLRAIVEAAAVPVLAIGGVSVENVAAVARAGAGGIAAIGLFASEQPLRATVERLRSRFDSAKPPP